MGPRCFMSLQKTLRTRSILLCVQQEAPATDNAPTVTDSWRQADIQACWHPKPRFFPGNWQTTFVPVQKHQVGEKEFLQTLVGMWMSDKGTVKSLHFLLTLRPHPIPEGNNFHLKASISRRLFTSRKIKWEKKKNDKSEIEWVLWTCCYFGTRNNVPESSKTIFVPSWTPLEVSHGKILWQLTKDNWSCITQICTKWGKWNIYKETIMNSSLFPWE